MVDHRREQKRKHILVWSILEKDEINFDELIVNEKNDSHQL